MVDDIWHYHRNDLNKVKVLTHEETIELFKQFSEIKEILKQEPENGKKASLKRAIIEIRNKIAEGNLRLVINIAKKFLIPDGYLKLLDLIQEGNVGLFKAIDKFDYKKGFRFSTYAQWWIKVYILKSIYDNSNVIKIPFRIREIISKIERVRGILKKENTEKKEEIVYDAVMSLYAISDKELRNFKKSFIREIIFLDDPIKIEDKYADNESGEKFLAIKDFARCDVSQMPENIVIDLEMKKEIRRFLTALTPQEEQIIRWRFGIDFFNAQTLQEIGDSYGLSRERIRQIEKLALEKLRTSFSAQEFHKIYYE